MMGTPRKKYDKFQLVGTSHERRRKEADGKKAIKNQFCWGPQGSDGTLGIPTVNAGGAPEAPQCDADNGCRTGKKETAKANAPFPS